MRTWRGRFADLGLPGLADRKRPGRPAAFTALQTAQVKALACQLPAETGAPLSRWSCPELAHEAVARRIVSAPVGFRSPGRIGTRTALVCGDLAGFAGGIDAGGPIHRVWPGFGGLDDMAVVGASSSRSWSVEVI
ncbi:helix-turn-helix domain-containing protein [Streptomyces natalensis]|uniref:helix-turn-helix domain-containing protein n=1 Tax=Streptomyces natalensis TaxID=68242 RepID=UPI000A7A055F|nr:helix-turn-helix domain-containing protein [Streptomyces natalensis]